MAQFFEPPTGAHAREAFPVQVQRVLDKVFSEVEPSDSLAEISLIEVSKYFIK
jgi:hypothetical protein